MIKHIWTVVCARSVIDSSTNNISLIDVLEQINITSPDSVQEGDEIMLPLNFELVSLWSRSNIDHPVQGHTRVKLIFPAGKELTSNEQGIDLISAPRCRTITKSLALPFGGIGILIFQVQYRLEGDAEWVDVGQIPLQISSDVAAQPQIPAEL